MCRQAIDAVLGATLPSPEPIEASRENSDSNENASEDDDGLRPRAQTIRHSYLDRCRLGDEFGPIDEIFVEGCQLDEVAVVVTTVCWMLDPNRALTIRLFTGSAAA